MGEWEDIKNMGDLIASASEDSADDEEGQGQGSSCHFVQTQEFQESRQFVCRRAVCDHGDYFHGPCPPGATSSMHNSHMRQLRLY